MKPRFIILLVCVLGLTAGVAINYQRFLPSASGNSIAALANWGEIAYTTEELYQSADVVVRGQVVSTRNRLHTEVLPIQGLTGETAERAKEAPEHILVLEKGMEERGMEGTPDDLTQEQKQEILEETTLDTKPIGEETYHVPYTDTTIEVTEILKGDTDKAIMVTQIGGAMPAPHTSEEPQMMNLDFAGNPQLQEGDEYILFLTHRDDSDSQIDTQGLERYILAGPTGQFRISGDAVSNTGDDHAAGTVNGQNLNKLPTDLDTLLNEIQRAAEAE
ncbi:MAG: hypothetical protein AAGF95_27670 [Chloroflexota bacterium]